MLVIVPIHTYLTPHFINYQSRGIISKHSLPLACTHKSFTHHPQNILLLSPSFLLKNTHPSLILHFALHQSYITRVVFLRSRYLTIFSHDSSSVILTSIHYVTIIINRVIFACYQVALLFSPSPPLPISEPIYITSLSLPPFLFLF